MKAKPDISTGGGAIALLSNPDVDLHSIFSRAVGYSSNFQAITDNRQFTHKSYVDTGLSGKLNTNSTLNNINAPTADFSMNSKKITNLADPING